TRRLAGSLLPPPGTRRWAKRDRGHEFFSPRRGGSRTPGRAGRRVGGIQLPLVRRPQLVALARSARLHAGRPRPVVCRGAVPGLGPVFPHPPARPHQLRPFFPRQLCSSPEPASPPAAPVVAALVAPAAERLPHPTLARAGPAAGFW